MAGDKGAQKLVDTGGVDLYLFFVGAAVIKYYFAH